MYTKTGTSKQLLLSNCEPYPLKQTMTARRSNDMSTDVLTQNREGTKNTKDISITQRMTAASLGGLLTSLLVTPFDVVKNRLQAQSPSITSNGTLHGRQVSASCSRCSHVKIHYGIIDVWCRQCDFPRPLNSHFSGGFLDAVYKLGRYEGIGSLWRGLAPTLLMSIPATVFYFSTYDLFVDYLRPSPIAPLIAGTTARAITTTLVAPFELIRTKQQSLPEFGNQSMRYVINTEISNGGWTRLWRGVAPTLWRDVPFSSVYWISYENGKKWLSGTVLSDRGAMGSKVSSSSSRELWAAFLAGSISGTLAATITHPFDLIKPRRQIDMYAMDATKGSSDTALNSSTIQIIRHIIRNEGFGALFIGWGARVTKIAPSCAIMISSYEYGKAYFRQQLS